MLTLAKSKENPNDAHLIYLPELLFPWSIIDGTKSSKKW